MLLVGWLVVFFLQIWNPISQASLSSFSLLAFDSFLVYSGVWNMWSDCWIIHEPRHSAFLEGPPPLQALNCNSVLSSSGFLPECPLRLRVDKSWRVVKDAVSVAQGQSSRCCHCSSSSGSQENSEIRSLQWLVLAIHTPRKREPQRKNCLH